MRVVTNLHHIRKHILNVLTMQKWARFSEMRPPRVDSNLYNYHLKELIKDGYVEHHPEKNGYWLSPMGLRFVDHVSLETFEPRWQPKLLTKLVTVQNGHILMWPKYKQPFIGKWSLPSGKIHYDDVSVETAMRREMQYFTNAEPNGLRHTGIVEYSAYIHGDLVTHTFGHVFTADIPRDSITNPRAKWVDLRDLPTLEMSPGTKETIEKTLTTSDFFFETYDINW